jgi:uncharacterized protein YwqG
MALHHVHMTIDLKLLTSMAHEFLGPTDAEAFIGLARPAIALRRPTSETAMRGHLGGEAALEPNQPWPTWDGKPLSLLAVLDLHAFQGYDCDLDLPGSGRVNLFYDVDQQPWGFDPAHGGGWRVILADPKVAADRAGPIGATRFSRIGLEPTQTLTMPSWDEEALEGIFRLDFDAMDDLSEALIEASEVSEPRHQVGGWPWLQQGSLWREFQFASNGVYVGDPSGYEGPRASELRLGVDEWKLLAQIDSDDDAGWMWGDAGTLYFGIRNADLANSALDRAWMVLQCG